MESRCSTASSPQPPTLKKAILASGKSENVDGDPVLSEKCTVLQYPKVQGTEVGVFCLEFLIGP